MEKHEPTSGLLFSEEEQHYDKSVNTQPWTIIWQLFLACALSFPLTPGHWGSPGKTSITCTALWSSHRSKNTRMLCRLGACLALSNVTNALQTLTCNSCCQICCNWQMQWAHQILLPVSRISGWQHQSTPTAKVRDAQDRIFDLAEKTVPNNNTTQTVTNINADYLDKYLGSLPLLCKTCECICIYISFFFFGAKMFWTFCQPYYLYLSSVTGRSYLQYMGKE